MEARGRGGGRRRGGRKRVSASSPSSSKPNHHGSDTQSKHSPPSAKSPKTRDKQPGKTSNAAIAAAAKRGKQTLAAELKNKH